MVNKLLFSLSRSEKFCDRLMHSRFYRKFSKRFVAGTTLEQAIKVAIGLEKKGVLTTLDHLGEAITTKKEALYAVREYVRIIRKIDSNGLGSHIAVKLSQLGLEIDKAYCERNLEAILASAKKHKVFVEVDMEQSKYTDDTLDIVTRMHKKYKLGVALQANLRRSDHDLGKLVDKGIFVRLVKGAYLEPIEVAFVKKNKVDSSFESLMNKAMGKTHLAIATHDDDLIVKGKVLARKQDIHAYEFQMLYGVRSKMQHDLAVDGYSVRVYIPYGEAWAPYFMRRLAERPANLWFLLKNMFRK